MTHNPNEGQQDSLTNDGSSAPGTEATHKGGTEPAKDQAKRDFEDSPKEDGE